MLSSQLLRIGPALAMCVALAACGYQGSEPNEEVPADTEESEQVESSNGSSNDDSETAEGKQMNQGNIEQSSLEEAVDAALQDLAERSGVTPESISVVEARKVTWRNGAMGCPEPGMMYTQALVEGIYILLSDGDSEYAYHAGRDGKPFFCPAERSQPPATDESKPRM